MWTKIPDALTGGKAQDAVGRAFGELQRWSWACQLTCLILAFTLLVSVPGFGLAVAGTAVTAAWLTLILCSAGTTTLLAWSATRYPAIQFQRDRTRRLAAIEEFAEAEHRRLVAEYEAEIKALEPPKVQPVAIVSPSAPRKILTTSGGPRYADTGLVPYQAEPARDYYAGLVKLLQLRPIAMDGRDYALTMLHLLNTPVNRALTFWVHALWLAECSSKQFRGWASPAAEEVLQRYQTIIANADAPYPTVVNRTVSLLQKSGACFLHPDAEMGERVAWLLQNPEQTPLYQQHYVEWCLLAEQNNWDPPCVADLYYSFSTSGDGYWGLDRPLEKRGYFPGTGNLDREHTTWNPADSGWIVDTATTAAYQDLFKTTEIMANLWKGNTVS